VTVVDVVVVVLAVVVVVVGDGLHGSLLGGTGGSLGIVTFGAQPKL
jgi:hypothetical protein